MRIISGKYKGYKLVSVPKDNVRPTGDHVKEAIFNMLGSFVEDAKVVDVFAGTGSLGLEAISRGASSCVFVDKAIMSIKTIKANINHLGIPSNLVECVISEATKFFNSFDYYPFDLTFIDPPYNKGLIDKIIDIFSEKNFLSDGGILVIESEKTYELPKNDKFEILNEKIYGITKIIILKGAEK